jgi:diguanylate cyclase (GGDEF)-like protein
MGRQAQSFVLSLTIVIAVGAIGSLAYKRMSAHYLQQIRTTVTGYAHCASLLIDGDAHEGFDEPEDMDSQALVDMRERLGRFMQIDERISDIYTMTRTDRANNIWKFVIDIARSGDVGGHGIVSEPEKPLPLGEEYDVATRPELQEALSVPVAETEIHDGRRGGRLSAYAPIFNSANEAVAIVGIDISADTIRQEMSGIRNTILFSCIFLALLVVVVLNAHACKLTKRIDGLVRTGEERATVGHNRGNLEANENQTGLAASVNSTTENTGKGFDKLSILSRIADMSATSSDLGQALETSVKLALQASKSTRGAIFLLREKQGNLALATSHGIEGIRSVGEECFVGAERLPTVLEKDSDVQIKQWLDLTGCTRCFFLKIRDSLRGVFLLDPQVEDEEFLQTLMTEISFGVEIARLLRDAITDTTTGLFMKRYFQIQLDTETKRSQRYKMGLSLLMLDIDHFKTVNDTCGHQFGDLVLREIAKIITGSVRKTDVVARYGGDEIVIILPDATKESAKMVADRILKGVREKEFQYENKTIGLTVSMGISNMSGEEPLSSEQLLRLADSALYKAKEAGKNTIHVV